MFFKNYEQSMIFCLFCLVLLFGVAGFLVISEYTHFEPKQNDPTWFLGKEKIMEKLRINPHFWKFSPGDGRISNIENIVIHVFTLWGIMRIVDLFKLASLIDEERKWEEIV